MNTLGSTTESVFLKQPESHKLHQEFTVKAATAMVKGLPVKMSDPDEVEPAGAGEANMNIIGYAIHDAAAGETVTVAMRAYTIIWAEAHAAIAAGPVLYQAVAAGAVRVDDAAVAAGTYVGWALDDAAVQGDKIRVALR